MSTNQITHDDVIDLRNVTDRVEALEEERDDIRNAYADASAATERPAGWSDALEAAARADALKAGKDWTDLEELIKARDAASEAVREWDASDEARELSDLNALLDSLRGYGGNHQWRGDWYPDMLIADDHFKDYAQELAEDCGMVQAGATWPNNCIDWEQAARELQQDYTCEHVTLDGSESVYWYR